MKNRRIILLFLLIIILLLLFYFLFYYPVNHSKPKKIIPEKIEVEEVEKVENENIPEENPKSDPVEEIKEEKKEEKNPPVPETPKEKPAPVETPTVTYTCPEGYTLEDVKCRQVISANHVCPEGTTDFSDENTPRDTYCVNLDEGYQSDSDSCPEGYGTIMQLGIGSPTIYRCIPLHLKIYTCSEGYTLEDKSCIKIIDATKN